MNDTDLLLREMQKRWDAVIQSVSFPVPLHVLGSIPFHAFSEYLLIVTNFVENIVNPLLPAFVVILHEFQPAELESVRSDICRARSPPVLKMDVS